jgi:hypothetical protein
LPSSKAELVAASELLADALQYMRGPTGEVIALGGKLPPIAWHLARAGCYVDLERAIIKRRAIPNRLGQLAGLCDWVPWDAPDPEGLPELVSAVGSSDVDPERFFDELPWHVRTKIEGKFT